MTQGFSHFDWQLRNDLLVIISLITAASVEIPLVQSGLAKHLALFATFQEGCFPLESYVLFALLYKIQDSDTRLMIIACIESLISCKTQLPSE